MTPLLWALIIGAGTAVALVIEHYLLDHRAPWFRAYPPRAYTAGVLTLFVGYAVWGALVPGPLPTGDTLGYLFLITGCGGAGTWIAYHWHGHQDTYRAEAATAQRERR